MLTKSIISGTKTRLRGDALQENKRGKIVSKKNKLKGHKHYGNCTTWIAATREVLQNHGLEKTFQTFKIGSDLHVEAKAIQARLDAAKSAAGGA